MYQLDLQSLGTTLTIQCNGYFFWVAGNPLLHYVGLPKFIMTFDVEFFIFFFRPTSHSLVLMCVGSVGELWCSESLFSVRFLVKIIGYG